MWSSKCKMMFLCLCESALPLLSIELEADLRENILQPTRKHSVLYPGFQQESLRNTRYINADRTIVFKPDTSPTWKHRIFLPRLLWKHQTNSLPLNVLSNFPHTKSVWQLRQNYFGIDLIDHCSCSKALSKSKGKGIQHDYVKSTYYWLMDIEHKKMWPYPSPHLMSIKPEISLHDALMQSLKWMFLEYCEYWGVLGMGDSKKFRAPQRSPCLEDIWNDNFPNFKVRLF